MSKKGRISKMCEESELRRGPWTLEEDNLLIHYITCHGEGRWNALANFAGLKRTGKSCRLRWLNYLNPSIKRGNLTPQEQLLILELHSKWGNRWSKIALHLPGRTDNEIKNYWRTRVQKQARQLKVDSNSNKFLDAIRSIWMPTLMDPSSSSIQTSNSNTAPVFNHSHHLTLNSNFPDSNLQPPENLTPSKINPQVDYHDIQEMESHHISPSGCHVAGSDWFGDDLGSSTFWNTDELWQLGWSWPVDTQT